jgi:hypothetical protein
MNLQERPTSYLRRRRTTLVKRLAAVDAYIFRGSLIKRFIRCGKPGCKCSETQGHGPKYSLSVSYPGRRPEQDYVPQQYEGQVRQFLSNYQKVKQILEEISNINREILRRREAL